MPALTDTHFLTGDLLPGAEVADVEWLTRNRRADDGGATGTSPSDIA